jgi:hypothetical protein
MRKLKQIIRLTTLYVLTVVLAGGMPMAAFADDSDPCAGTGHFSNRWATDPTTKQCVKLYEKDGTYVGPSYMAPAPNTPIPADTPSQPVQTPQSSDTPATTVQDNGDNNATGVNTSTNGTANTTDNTNVKVDNDIQSTSVSGDAKVSGSESKGGATSGNADTNATVVNTVHSTISGDTSGVATFTYDVNGDVTGDITLNGAGDSATINKDTNLNANTTVNNNVSLNNDVNLTSKTGDAAVSGNESKGSATSGDANTVANVLNLINTIISANKSFVGTINIYGNLDGDILISSEFIPQLLASNAALNSTIDTSLSANLSDNQQIVNNVKLNATTGNATVSGNESAGGATTGVATTNLTILNLTGHQVTAANSLLVFVNVLGTWVGMIVDAPGATAAALGSGITSNTTTNINEQANLNNNVGINNNVDLTSTSGNAAVSGNESRGDATSGNATASANIANISSTTFDLSSWFGVLFINVFGKWHGSFGVDTAAGTVVPLAGDATPPEQPAVAQLAAPTFRFGFTPRAATTDLSNYQLPAGDGVAQPESTTTHTPTVDLVSTHVPASKKVSETLVPGKSPHDNPANIVMMGAGSLIATIGAATGLVNRRRSSDLIKPRK